MTAVPPQPTDEQIDIDAMERAAQNSGSELAHTLVAALRDARAEKSRFEGLWREAEQHIARADAMRQRERDERDDARAEVTRLTGIVQAVETAHAELRRQIAFLHAWPDGVTGKRMVFSEDVLKVLDEDAPRFRAALTGGTDERD